MNPITDHEIDRLAWRIEAHGLSGMEDVLRRVVHRARNSGASRVLLEVLADAHAPEVARIRAFGRVAMHIAAENRRLSPLAAA
jgi:hypothetical protein